MEVKEMKSTVNLYDFREAFNVRKDSFSYAGLEALFNWLEEFEEGTGEEIELDPIGLCCEFAEYKNLAEFQNDYNEDYETLEDIEEATIVIRIDDDAFIIQCF